jgi:hypothetical protein
MARALSLTLFLFVVAASAASAQEPPFVDFAKNRDWPPTTDFNLTSNAPCDAGDCKFTARLTFRYGKKVLGKIPLQNPPQEGGNWDTKRYGHVDTTDQAQLFWNCDTPGTHTWKAKIWAIASDGTRTDYAPETGTWKQPGCSNGKPRKVSRTDAEDTAREKIGFGDRTIERASCKQTDRPGRWSCKVRWSNPNRTCNDTQSLFFYTRKIFFRRFNKVSSFREARKCTPAAQPAASRVQ